MTDKIITIESPCNLSTDTGRLKIVNNNTQAINYVAINDIACLIISNHTSNITTATISAINENFGVVVFTNSKYLPTSICFGSTLNNVGANRAYMQAKNLNTLLSKKAWQQIIISKIMGQSLVLKQYNLDSYKTLQSFIDYVELGDKTNIEAKVAKIYWESYFSLFNNNEKLNRNKQGATDVVNSCLNYGYTILRSLIARSQASLGLIMHFGVGHYAKDNPFNLVEDFIEPYRYTIDNIVLQTILEENSKNIEDLSILDTKIKKLLINAIYNLNTTLNGKNYRLIQGVNIMHLSYCNYLEGLVDNLTLPNLTFKGVKSNLATNIIDY